MTENFPRYGEIWLACFDPSLGSEYKGTRPALIIQNDIGNKHSPVTIVAAITTNLFQTPVTVLINKKDSGLKEDSIVKLNQIFTMDKQRLIKKIGILQEDKLMKINEALKLSLKIF